jgi:hypothetical protein
VAGSPQCAVRAALQHLEVDCLDAPLAFAIDNFHSHADPIPDAAARDVLLSTNREDGSAGAKPVELGLDLVGVPECAGFVFILDTDADVVAASTNDFSVTVSCDIGAP